MYPILTFCLLFGLWVVLSGLFDIFHLTLGVLASAWVAWISTSWLFPHRSKSLGARVREAARFPGYFIWLLWEIVLANVHVLYLALHPRGWRDLEPAVVRIQCSLKTEFARWVLANSITLTPGTVTVKIVGDTLYVHAISRKAALGLESEMEARIARVYEPGREA